ncbi:MAG TPA: LuxR C-terminal-related transcriptional regulator [Actinophytocola sp.]|uniref:response regulator transcription factor n=1 Tax=Actinophytocola sp. TaxID=1872138 RepID=UPI002DDD789B|nr:LuxR C-terminal-related transcriptional regulator [Actinophytocola sp.]HEV2781780.1 LuxR C-terminal-related transcriptional regulator [Actinophytocola sp.]
MPRLIAAGSTNREIAAGLLLSEGTVKNHISRILSRLGPRDRTQAAIYAREHGLIRPFCKTVLTEWQRSGGKVDGTVLHSCE